MKLEYLDDISDGGKYPHADPDKLLRLFDFEPIELTQLKDIIQIQLVNQNNDLNISSLDFVQPINCSLTFKVSDEDLGIKFPPKDGNKFWGEFSKSTYLNMIDIINKLENGFNWLYEPMGNHQIDLLLSRGGGW